VSSRRTLNPRASATRSTAAPTSRRRAPAVAALEGRPRRGDEALVATADRLDGDRGRGVAEVAVELDRDVELDQVAGLDPARPRDPVHGLVADADADRAREAIGDDRARSAALGGDDLGGQRVELAGADARRHSVTHLAQHARGQRPGAAQALELFR
jgi:hypothetical protein